MREAAILDGLIVEENYLQLFSSSTVRFTLV
jgi:hypothetical protein